MPDITTPTALAPIIPVAPAAPAAAAAGDEAGGGFGALLQAQIGMQAAAADTTPLLALAAETQDGQLADATAAADPALAALAALLLPAQNAEGGEVGDIAEGANALASALASALAGGKDGAPRTARAEPFGPARAGGATQADTGGEAAEAFAALLAAGAEIASARATPAALLPSGGEAIELPAAAVAEAGAPTPHALHAQGTGARPAEAAPERMASPVGSPAFADELGQKLTWMVGRDLSSAELTLTPPNLGRLEVTLTVSGDSASALFVTANPNVRESLEQAIPRLRELLAAAGIQLGQANVSADSAPRDGQPGQQGSRSTHGGSDAAAPVAAAAPAHWIRSGSGLVDTFA